MIELLLIIDGEEKSYNIPNSWSEVSVGQAMHLQHMAEFTGTDIERVVKILTIFCPDIDIDDIYAMTPEQFNQIVEMIGFVGTPVEGELVDSLMIGDEEYFLKKDFTQLTMGEVISIDMITNEANGDISKVLPKLLCVFLRKKKENGKLESFKASFMDRAEMFESVKIADVNNIFSFFTAGVPS